MIFLLFSLLLGEPLAQASPTAQDPAWRALLHFSGTKGGQSSAEAKSGFFLSAEGYRDPEAELEATLKYFREKPAEAACRYPARAIYLGAPETSPAEGDSPESWCGRWHKWRQAIRAKGASQPRA